ncbi:MAG: hypothetical protein ACP5GX_02265 [Anaerolineae bacterium]
MEREPVVESSEVPEPEAPQAPPEMESPASRERPRVTFMGNSYDLTSVGALASALLLMFMCLTCNMGFYCLPFIPLLLGAVGLFTANQSVDEERTRLFSWIGVGSGIFVLLFVVLAIVGYFALIIFAILMSEGRYGY